LLTGVLFGLAPALESTRATLAGSLKDDGALVRGRSRFGLRRLLVVAQVALCLLLLVGAGLFLRSLRNTAGINTGLKTDSVLMASVNPRLNGYTPAQVTNFYQQLQARLAAMPGVQAVGMSEVPLLSGSYNAVGLRIAGRPDPPQGRSIITNTVDPGLFGIAGIPIVRGRGFGPQDTPTSGRVAILSETAARYFFGDTEPIGRKVFMGGRTELEIIGIARDSKYRGVREDTPRIGYYDLAQADPPVVERTIYLRTAGDPTARAAALRAAIRGLDRNLPVYNMKTFDQQKDESLVRERMIATLSGFFGVLALLLAAIGIYGVMAYAVLRRTREIGIRMSLGAQPGNVLRLILRHGLGLALAGVALGVAGAIGLSRFLASELFEIKPTDPATYAMSVALMIGVALIACFIPARRATRTDPMVTLRHQ
jgi:predicted permease